MRDNAMKDNVMSGNSVQTQKRSGKRSLWQIFRAPLLIGVLSLVGLVAALVGDGPYDALSWLGLGIPCVLTIWYGWWKPRAE